MIASRRLAPLPLLLAGLEVPALVIALTVHARSQEVAPTADDIGTNPPARPTSLQASAEHDEVPLTWFASTDQTVTHHAILRRNPDTDASQVFHVIDSNAGPETSYTGSPVSASSRYNYRVKAVSPTGFSQWPGYVKAYTPATPEPESTSVDLTPPDLTAAPAEGGGVALTCTRSGGGSMTLEIDRQERNAHPGPARTPWNRAITRLSSKQMHRAPI